MGTKIEWTEATWNPVTGCSKVSAGCTNCYAEKLSHRFGWTDKPWNAAFAAENVKLHPERLELPLSWKKPRRVFVNSMSDLFHDQVPFSFLDEVFGVMVEAKQHTFQILTKRPQRMLEYMKTCQRGADAVEGKFPWSNVWLGVSVENQQAADERIPLLLQTPAAVRFLSCEPLLGEVDLTAIPTMNGLCATVLSPECWGDCACDAVFGYDPGCGRHGGDGTLTRRIDWLIAGGESGPNARPMHPDWTRSLRDQCVAAGVPFFFKQWGEWLPNAQEYGANPGDFDYERKHVMVGDIPMCKAGKKKAGRLLDGHAWDGYPTVAP